MENLQRQLLHHNTEQCIDYYENFMVRARGYHSFFGPTALPFGCDDFFSKFVLAKYKNSSFFTVKYSTLANYKNYNLESPIEKLLTLDQFANFEKVLPNYGEMGWSGGFTYLNIDELGKRDTGNLAKDLSAYYLCHCLKKYSPCGLLLTANLKAKVDRYLLKCGFEYVNIDQVIHPELNNNPAKLLVLKEPSSYMLDCYHTYNNFNTYTQEAA